MSHLEQTVTGVTAANPSIHEINDLSVCLFTQTKWLLFGLCQGSLSLSFHPHVMCLALSLCPILFLLRWPRLKSCNAKETRVRKERVRVGGWWL